MNNKRRSYTLKREKQKMVSEKKKELKVKIGQPDFKSSRLKERL